jgi:hypothetical protein
MDGDAIPLLHMLRDGVEPTGELLGDRSERIVRVDVRSEDALTS